MPPRVLAVWAKTMRGQLQSVEIGRMVRNEYSDIRRNYSTLINTEEPRYLELG